MADTKITALTALTAADPINDVIPIVDVSDTTMAASGTTKKISVNNILSSSPTASGALTVTGLVTAGSATITGAATVGTTLGVTGASNLSGVVTVSAGATSPLDLTNAAVTTERQIKITNSSVTAFLGVEPAAGGRFVGSAANNAYFGTNSAFGLEFATNNNVRMTVDTSGNVNVSSGNVVMSNGAGIDFAAKTPDGSGTVGSELLNDYEEGTWVGTLKGSISNPTVAVTATGKYTKVGRQVTVNINYNNVSTVGASGNVTIDGLPFIGADNFAGSSIAFDLFAISTTLASWNAGTEIEFFITGAYVKATHNPGTGRYLTTTITYNA